MQTLIFLALMLLSNATLADAIPACGGLPDTEAGGFVEAGTICRTKHGVNFERYRDPQSGMWGWKDHGRNGVIWYDQVASGVDFQQARAFCTQIVGGHIPYLPELESAWGHFIEEVIREKRSGYLWADAESTVKPGISGCYTTRTGEYRECSMSVRDPRYHVRCVGRFR